MVLPGFAGSRGLAPAAFRKGLAAEASSLILASGGLLGWWRRRRRSPEHSAARSGQRKCALFCADASANGASSQLSSLRKAAAKIAVNYPPRREGGGVELRLSPSRL